MSQPEVQNSSPSFPLLQSLQRSVDLSAVWHFFPQKWILDLRCRLEPLCRRLLPHRASHRVQRTVNQRGEQLEKRNQIPAEKTKLGAGIFEVTGIKTLCGPFQLSQRDAIGLPFHQ